MRAVYPSLEGGGSVSVKAVKLKGMKVFSAVSKQTGKDSLNNPSLSKVDIKSTVRNNVITIERFKFKFAGFRPRIEGQTSISGAVNSKRRLGLPPLGIVGIPIRITGTQDNPIIKVSKSAEDNVNEEEYQESDADQR